VFADQRELGLEEVACAERLLPAPARRGGRLPILVDCRFAVGSFLAQSAACRKGCFYLLERRKFAVFVKSRDFLLIVKHQTDLSSDATRFVACCLGESCGFVVLINITSSHGESTLKNVVCIDEKVVYRSPIHRTLELFLIFNDLVIFFNGEGRSLAIQVPFAHL